MKHFLIVLLLFLGLDALAQKETYNWYFGQFAGVRFNGNAKPTAVTNSAMSTFEGCATISNKQGRLLFYTDGLRVYDSTHNMMPNGNGLLGNSSATQSGIAIPKPGSSNLFYIFTADAQENGCRNGLRYSELNMNLNNGKGDITSTKNVQLLSYTTEKVTATKQANGVDYWVCTIKQNSDTFYAYGVTSSGVNHTPVRSSFKWRLSTNNLWGTLKFSPKGDKVVFGNGQDSVMIADFNSKTGVISNAYSLGKFTAYGVEFSLKGKFLYLSDWNLGNVYQIDLRSNNRATIIASRQAVVTNLGGGKAGALQLGPDNRIYFAVNGSSYLHAFMYPDSLGSGSTYTSNYVSLNGKTSSIGLPTFMQSFFIKNEFEANRTCIRDTTFFTLTDQIVDSVRWYFGDSLSGSKNTSTLKTGIYHIYKKVGKYTVKLISYTKFKNDTIVKKISIVDSKPQLGVDKIICNNFNFIELKPSGNFVSYLWSNGSPTKEIYITKKGIYILRTLDTTGCLAFDTIQVFNPKVKAKFIGDTLLCPKELFKFKNASVVQDDTIQFFKYEFPDKTVVFDSLSSKRFKNNDSFLVKFYVRTASNCIDSSSRYVKTKLQPIASFSTLGDTLCWHNKPINLINSSTFEPNTTSHLWDFGDNTFSSKVLPNDKHYNNSNQSYTITYYLNSNNGCTDTLKKKLVLKERPIAVFNVNDTQQCQKSNVFKLANNSSFSQLNALKYNWSFGDGNGSTLKVPSDKVYSNSGWYRIQLIVHSATTFCNDTVATVVNVAPHAVPDFRLLKDTQCISVNSFRFINQSQLIAGSMSYKWDYGDGKFGYSKDVQHSYLGVNVYSVKLKVTTNFGCTDSITKTATTVLSPKAIIGINDTQQCFNAHAFDFINATSTQNGSVIANWKIDDVDAGVSDMFNSKFSISGLHKIQLIVFSSNMCSDTAIRQVYLESPGKLNISVNPQVEQCLRYNKFNFNVNSIDPRVTLQNFIWDFGDAQSAYSKSVSHTYQSTGKKTVQAITQSINGCHDSNTIEVTLHSMPLAKFDSDTTCFKEAAYLVNRSISNGSNIVGYQWMFGDLTSSTDKDPIKYYAKSGTYDVRLIAISDKNCRDTSQKQEVIIRQLPVSKFDYVRLGSKEFETTRVQLINQSYSNIIKNSWSYNNGNVSTESSPEISTKDTGQLKIQLAVEDIYGCRDTSVVVTKRLFPDFFFHLPNAFTPDPNGSSVNQTFKPLASKYVKSYTMEIYNRWGEKVFESKDINIGWDGTYKGELCQQDIYLCRIYVIPYFGPIQSHETTITLLR